MAKEYFMVEIGTKAIMNLLIGRHLMTVAQEMDEAYTNMNLG